MKLWESCLKIWEMLRDTSPEETTQSLFKKLTETKGSLSGKRDAGEYSDKTLPHWRFELVLLVSR